MDDIFQLAGKSMRPALEALMDTLQGHKYRTDFLRKSFDEGVAKGEARGQVEGKVEHARGTLLRVLAKRRLTVSARLRRRISAERDLRKLDHWLDVAVTATSVAEVFADA